MNQRQLSNVLVKILGLSFCVHGFPALVVAVLGGLALLIHAMHDGHPGAASIPYWTYSVTYLIQSVIEFAVGVYLVLGSQWLTEKLFQNDHP